MVKLKACRACKRVYEGDKCPDCGSQEYTEDFKGRVMIFDTEHSEIAQKLKITKKGLYAIKTK
jgi:DNA-directed RNA polymerase subunit E"